MNLEKLIENYRQWMILNRYADSTCNQYNHVLAHFAGFVSNNKLPWENVFTYDTLQKFQNQSGLTLASHAIKGMSRYLFKQNKINHPIFKPIRSLPENFETYLDYCTQIKEVSHLHGLRIRKNLCAFSDFLETNSLSLKSIQIESV